MLATTPNSQIDLQKTKTLENFQVDGFKSFFPLHEKMIQFDSLFFKWGWFNQQPKFAGEEMVIPNGGALNRNMVPLTPSGLMSLGPFFGVFFVCFFF